MSTGASWKFSCRTKEQVFLTSGVNQIYLCYQHTKYLVLLFMCRPLQVCISKVRNSEVVSAHSYWKLLTFPALQSEINMCTGINNSLKTKCEWNTLEVFFPVWIKPAPSSGQQWIKQTNQQKTPKTPSPNTHKKPKQNPKPNKKCQKKRNREHYPLSNYRKWELLKENTYLLILSFWNEQNQSAFLHSVFLFIRSCNLISYFWMLFMTCSLSVLLLHCRFRRTMFVVLPGKSFKWLFWGSFYQLCEDKSRFLLNRLQQCTDTFHIQRCPGAVFNFKQLSRSHRKMMCWSGVFDSAL